MCYSLALLHPIALLIVIDLAFVAILMASRNAVQVGGVAWQLF